MAALTKTPTNTAKSLLPAPISSDYYDVDFTTAVNALEPDDMTQEEAAHIETLRTSIHGALNFDQTGACNLSVPKDLLPLFSKARLLQFGRARQNTAKKWDFTKSTSMFIDMLIWYRAYDLPAQVAQWENVDSKGFAGAVFRKWVCCGAFGVDKRGVPVMHVRPGFDIKGLVRAIGYEAYERGSLHQLWYIGKGLEEASLKHGKHLVSGCVVLDYLDFSWTRTYNNLKPFGKHVKIQDLNFPERLYTCLIIRAPWIFNGIWRVFKPFLARDTVAKIKILGRSADHLTQLEQVIDRSQIPVYLGGELVGWPYGEGGDIPVDGGLQGGDSANGGGGETKCATGKSRSSRRSSMSVQTLHVATKESIQCPLKKGDTMLFQWNVTDYDIDFTSYLHLGKEENEEQQVIAPTARISADSDGLQTLEYTAKENCAIVLDFDNTFSYYREKDITYELHVVPRTAVDETTATKEK